jgi:diguanylate cyclase (GGDEF)-like protein/PAS domain S-box-containing protein
MSPNKSDTGGQAHSRWVEKYYYSPWRILLVMLITIFSAEALADWMLSLVSLPKAFHILFDVAAQLLILLPVFHFFFFGPLVHHIEHGRRINQDLVNSSEWIQAILNTVFDAILVLDAQGVIRDLNLAAERIFGFSRAELLGLPLERLIAEQDRGEIARHLANLTYGDLSTLGSGQVLHGRRRNDEWFPLELAVSKMTQGSASIWVATVHDITRRKQIEQALQQAHDVLELRVEQRTAELAQANADLEAQILERSRIEAQLQQLATTDSLTGLSNRRQFETHFAMELERARRYRSNLALIMFDIDHFKSVNDTFGHQVGDEVLVELSKLMAQELRVTDILARWGGEEFLVLALETGMEDACTLAEKLRSAVEQHPFATVPEITCSFGVTAYVVGDSSFDLLKRADDAMYLAKRNGRNRVEQMAGPV